MNKFMLLLFGFILSLITAAPTRACDTEQSDKLTLSSYVDEVNVTQIQSPLLGGFGGGLESTSIEFETSDAYKPEMVDTYSFPDQYQSANPHEGGRGSPTTIVQSGDNFHVYETETGYHPKEEPT